MQKFSELVINESRSLRVRELCSNHFPYEWMTEFIQLIPTVKRENYKWQHTGGLNVYHCTKFDNWQKPTRKSGPNDK